MDVTEDARNSKASQSIVQESGSFPLLYFSFTVILSLNRPFTDIWVNGEEGDGCRNKVHRRDFFFLLFSRTCSIPNDMVVTEK